MRWAAWLLLFPVACAADTITGMVGAPGGVLAMDRWQLFGAAHAHVPGLQAVSGASVELIEIGQRGAPLGSGKTDAKGSYTIPLPQGFQPSPRYIVRASQGANRMDAFVSAARTNIDPATDATVRLVLEHSDIHRVRPADVAMLLPLVQHLAWEVPPARSGVALAAALRKAAAEDDELYSIVSSMGAAGEIAGTVVDSAGKPLERISVVARDANSGLVRALTYTDAGGAYQLRVPRGEYILWAINETARSPAASAAAEGKVAVGETPARRNFRLAAGGRVSGVVAGADGTKLTNIRITLRDPRSGRLLIELRTQDHGGFRVSLPPGSYVLAAENPTLQPFASALGGLRIDLEAGAELPTNIELPAGQLVSGRATPGATMRVHESGSGRQVAVVRANRGGQYRLWLEPGRYSVQ